ncbi:hypothetical protein HDU91_003868 [Kappamyces sp. JEL0680]|nr:hypothetical protein HDU91_003868 [Kappamyces sp. JEL0680]
MKPVGRNHGPKDHDADKKLAAVSGSGSGDLAPEAVSKKLEALVMEESSREVHLSLPESKVDTRTLSESAPAVHHQPGPQPKSDIQVETPTEKPPESTTAQPSSDSLLNNTTIPVPELTSAVEPIIQIHHATQPTHDKPITQIMERLGGRPLLSLKTDFGGNRESKPPLLSADATLTPTKIKARKGSFGLPANTKPMLVPAAPEFAVASGEQMKRPLTRRLSKTSQSRDSSPRTSSFTELDPAARPENQTDNASDPVVYGGVAERKKALLKSSESPNRSVEPKGPENAPEAAPGKNLVKERMKLFQQKA